MHLQVVKVQQNETVLIVATCRHNLYSNCNYLFHYKVEIKAIVETIIPELTDEWVKKQYEYMGFTTVVEFKDYAKDYVRKTDIISDIWRTVVEDQDIESFDSEEYDKLVDQYKGYFESMLSYYYGYIFMYGAFRYTKMLCSLPYGCIIFNNIFSNTYGALFNIFPQTRITQKNCLLILCEDTLK